MKEWASVLVLAGVAVACSSPPPSFKGEWVMRSVDSVTYTMVIADSGVLRFHAYYRGSDSAYAARAKEADSLLQLAMTKLDVRPSWSVRGDTLCMMGSGWAEGLFQKRTPDLTCRRFAVGRLGNRDALRLADDSTPHPRYVRD